MMLDLAALDEGSCAGVVACRERAVCTRVAGAILVRALLLVLVYWRIGLRWREQGRRVSGEPTPTVSPPCRSCVGIASRLSTLRPRSIVHASGRGYRQIVRGVALRFATSNVNV